MIEQKKEVKKKQQKLGNKYKTLFLWCFSLEHKSLVQKI